MVEFNLPAAPPAYLLFLGNIHKARIAALTLTPTVAALSFPIAKRTNKTMNSNPMIKLFLKSRIRILAVNVKKARRGRNNISIWVVDACAQD